MPNLIKIVEDKYKKSRIIDVKSGDSVAVHQKIKEGSKERVQVFEGTVIRTSKKGSLSYSITVRRIASGVGVEKSFVLHSPSILKVVVSKRSNVRRNRLSYLKSKTGKAGRLSNKDFDKQAVNAVHDEKADIEEEKLREEAQAVHEAEEAAAKEAAAKEEAAHAAEFAAHAETATEQQE
jgi:large subunit ribosomal protein L19